MNAYLYSNIRETETGFAWSVWTLEKVIASGVEPCYNQASEKVQSIVNKHQEA